MNGFPDAESRKPRNLKYEIFVGLVILACIVGGLWFFTGQGSSNLQLPIWNGSVPTPPCILSETIPAQNISVQLRGPGDYFAIEAQVPETPRYVPLYKGTLSDDDLDQYFKYRAPNRSTVKNSTPSKSEAPAIAEKALVAYGGLPSDAVLSLVYVYESITQNSSGEITERHPVMTQVSYTRQINGIPVTGERDVISVDLGENGELLTVIKRWRTLEKTGEIVQVIKPDKAVEKLLRGETYTKCQSGGPVNINEIRLCYYEKPGKIREIILEPVWNFKNTREPGCEFPVYARQIANFTATPAPGSVPLNIDFTDTSDATPTRWYWDFGDGANSTIQNPDHVYQAPGTYNVTMTVWNDLGSDTTTKSCPVDLTPQAKK